MPVPFAAPPLPDIAKMTADDSNRMRDRSK
jgi:hypothetical protein